MILDPRNQTCSLAAEDRPAIAGRARSRRTEGGRPGISRRQAGWAKNPVAVTSEVQRKSSRTFHRVLRLRPAAALPPDFAQDDFDEGRSEPNQKSEITNLSPRRGTRAHSNSRLPIAGGLPRRGFRAL